MLRDVPQPKGKMAVKRKQGKRQPSANELARALSHPLRSDMLTILSRRTASPVEMARELVDDNPGIQVTHVDYHVRRLLELHCAELVSERPARGATEHFYKATVRNYLDLKSSEGMHPAVADHYAGQVLGLVLADVAAAVEGGTFEPREDLHLTNDQHVLDEEGWGNVYDILMRARTEIEEEEERSAGRLVSSPEDAMAASVSLLGFRMPLQGKDS